MKRPPVFLQNGGSCLSTIVLTISLIASIYSLISLEFCLESPLLISHPSGLLSFIHT